MLTWFFSICLEICMAVTDLNMIIQSVPNKGMHVLVSTHNSCCDTCFTFAGSQGTKTLCFIHPQRNKRHRALDLDILVVNMSVPCSGLLNCQSSIEVDFDPGYFKPPYAIWQRSVLRQQPHTKHVEVNSFSHCIGHSSDQNVTLTQWPQKFRSNALAFFLLGSHQRQGSCSSTFCDCKWPKAIQSCCVC